MKNPQCLLFVPARKKMLDKIPTMEADIFIIDLEDSIPENEKDLALEQTSAFLETHADFHDKIVVRTNKERCSIEFEALQRFSTIGFMLPKFECDDDYQDCTELLESRFTIALVETPLGIANLQGIAKNTSISGIAFGAEDYTAKANMDNTDQLLMFQKSMIVTFAKAYGKAAYDTPSFSINDDDKFLQEVKLSSALGFDGKLAIHPKQVSAIKNAFTVKDLDNLREIVETFEVSGDGVVVIDGKPYEKMHIDRFKRILKEAEEK